MYRGIFGTQHQDLILLGRQSIYINTHNNKNNILLYIAGKRKICHENTLTTHRKHLEKTCCINIILIQIIYIYIYKSIEKVIRTRSILSIYPFIYLSIDISSIHLSTIYFFPIYYSLSILLNLYLSLLGILFCFFVSHYNIK